MPITMADPPLTTLALDPDALLANLFRVHHGPLVRTATLLLDDRHHRTEGAPLGRPGHRPDVVPRTGRERAVRERAPDVRPLVMGMCEHRMLDKLIPPGNPRVVHTDPAVVEAYLGAE